jgi:hypothetical protein
VFLRNMDINTIDSYADTNASKKVSVSLALKMEIECFSETWLLIQCGFVSRFFSETMVFTCESIQSQNPELQISHWCGNLKSHFFFT